MKPKGHRQHNEDGRRDRLRWWPEAEGRAAPYLPPSAASVKEAAARRNREDPGDQRYHGGKGECRERHSQAIHGDWRK